VWDRSEYRERMQQDGSLDDASDVTLAERSADGDAEAFAVLVRRYGPLIRAYAARMLGTSSGDSSADADDVVQEAVLQAWQRAATLDEPARVRAWLFRITANKAIDRIRRRHPQQELETVDDARSAAAPTTEQIVTVRLQMADLAAALRELPDAQRIVWVMREIGGSSYADIAEATELPLATVRGMLARARRRVLERMEGWR
jgi:RNA polymerase sigma-70 factor, ECF subfamily